MYQVKTTSLYYFIGQTFILLGMIALCSVPAFAAPPINEWSPQERIPEYEDITEEPPFLVADRNRTVHAFNSQSVLLDEDTSPKAVVYRQWTLEGGWTKPIDILLNPGGNDLELMDVYFDQVASEVYLVLQMKDEILYSKAPLSKAGQAPGWSTPTRVGGAAEDLHYNAAITGDGQGNLVIIYGGYLEGRGIYFVYSDDYGDTWSDPIYLLLSYDQVSTGPTLFTDHLGQIHAAWNTFDSKGVGVSGHYARLNVETGQWSEPIEIDEGGIFLGIKFTQLFEYGEDLFLAYYGGRDNANWWRRSRDGGVTWSNPARISSKHVGTNGPVSFVVDSNNNLHLFFGQRINDENHGMWHSIWNGSGWNLVTPIVRGPSVVDQIGGKAFDPRHPRTAIVNGNILLVTWATDGGAGVNGAWYSYTILNAPELPIKPLPTVPVTPTATPTPAGTLSVSGPISSSLPTRHVSANYQIDESSADEVNNPAMPVIIGVAPVILLLVTFFAVYQLHTRR